jgi:hypothetical protein
LAIPTAEPTAARIKPHLELNFDECPTSTSLKKEFNLARSALLNPGLKTHSSKKQKILKSKTACQNRGPPDKNSRFFYIGQLAQGFIPPHRPAKKRPLKMSGLLKKC